MSSPPLSRRALVQALAGAHALATPRRAHTAPPDAIAAFAAAQRHRYGLPAMCVAILSPGRPPRTLASGLASLELAVPATPATVLQIASVSKIVASVAVMLLVEERRLSLDTPVARLLPGLPPAWSAIEVHHLMSHTAGIARGVSELPAYQEEERRRKERSAFVDAEKLDLFTAEELLGYVSALPLRFPPGAEFSYTFSGYLVLGLIVERLSGVSYRELVQRRIFDPLGMTSARFGDSRVVVPGRATAYTRQNGGVLQTWSWSYSVSGYPAAGLNCSVCDLARFFGGLTAGRLLRRDSVERLWTAAPLAGGRRARYGLGWSVYEVAGRKAVGHEGGGCAWVTHLPDDGVTAIALSNLAGARADDTADELARLALVSRTAPRAAP